MNIKKKLEDHNNKIMLFMLLQITDAYRIENNQRMLLCYCCCSYLFANILDSNNIDAQWWKYIIIKKSCTAKFFRFSLNRPDLNYVIFQLEFIFIENIAQLYYFFILISWSNNKSEPHPLSLFLSCFLFFLFSDVMV